MTCAIRCGRQLGLEVLCRSAIQQPMVRPTRSCVSIFDNTIRPISTVAANSSSRRMPSRACVWKISLTVGAASGLFGCLTADPQGTFQPII